MGKTSREKTLWTARSRRGPDYALKWGYPLGKGNQVLAYGSTKRYTNVHQTRLMLSILLDELRKPADSRLEWLYITDIDTLVLKPTFSYHLLARIRVWSQSAGAR